LQAGMFPATAGTNQATTCFFSDLQKKQGMPQIGTLLAI
jgi:hypothetical protein